MELQIEIRDEMIYGNESEKILGLEMKMYIIIKLQIESQYENVQ